MTAAFVITALGFACGYVVGRLEGELRGRRQATEECTRRIDEVIAAKAKREAAQ